MDAPDQRKPRLAPGVRLQIDPKTSEPVLLFPEGVLFLSATANDVLTRCAGQDTVSSIIDGLADEYDADPETLRQDVLDCLNDLYQRRLVLF